MYKRMVIVLIVVSTLVIGSISFSGSPAQASTNCGSDSIVLAANPELAFACRYQGVANGNETETGSRVIEANVVRSIGLPGSTFIVANPELLMVRRDAVVKGEVDPDEDVGLLEFFVVSDETNGDRASQRKADEDIGLLEFFRP